MPLANHSLLKYKENQGLQISVKKPELNSIYPLPVDVELKIVWTKCCCFLPRKPEILQKALVV